MDIAILVKNITAAFEDASSLVQRIRKRKETDPTSRTEDIDDLLDSLSLGPTVVRGYYESDARRFGNVYMTGDSIAREQLKDALINLQMTVLSSLSAVILDDQEPDYDAIQAASDDCRVNVGVCLGQLSQRMSKSARGHNVAGKIPTYDNGQVGTIQRSNSRSTQSSGPNRGPPMTPPESLSDTEYPGESASNVKPRRQQSFSRRSDRNTNQVLQTQFYDGPNVISQDHTNHVPNRFRRSSNLPLPMAPESPASPQEQLPSKSYQMRDMSASTSTMSPTRTHAGFPQQQGSQEGLRLGSSPSNDTIPIHFTTQQSNDTRRYNPYNELTSATLGRSRSGSNSIPSSRQPAASLYDPSSASSPLYNEPYPRHAIPEEEKEVYYSPPIPVRAAARPPPDPRAISVAGSDAMQRPLSGPLTLPTDKNLLGFCKGAFRLQAGMDKKAFAIANRPVGNFSMVQYWKCDKCYFEGQCTTLVPPGGKKPEKLFDPIIREHDGIRYKWAFLARCHVPLKTMPEGRRDGLFGSFGCIFCTAEAAQRGWPVMTNDQNARRTSVRSTSSGGPAVNGTLVFGNIHGLMDHLQMHRQQEFWPGVEMQGRMKCVVGRIAQRGEEFDINLLPVD